MQARVKKAIIFKLQNYGIDKIIVNKVKGIVFKKNRMKFRSNFFIS